MKYNQLKTTFSANTENINLARSIGVAFLMNLELNISFVNEVKTIISEAITNAIVHGCLCDENKFVHLNLRYDEENIYVEVIDYGIGIEDIDKAKEPLYTTKIDEERSGLGFTIMEVFSDTLDITSKLNEGTKVVMSKKYINI